MEQRYRETKVREKRLKQLGFKVMTKWSCQFEKEKKSIPKVRDSILEADIQKPINLRDSFFGGRTNAVILHKQFKGCEKGHYVDFTSLYPSVMKHQKYPVGHPKKIVCNFEQPFSKPCEGNCEYLNCKGSHVALPYFGLMKVTVLPPSDLYFPALPVKCGVKGNEKLKFPLCFKCASEDSKGNCDCTDDQRSFTHTYCTPEIEIALNAGYKILKVHEVLHWAEFSQYNHETKRGGLFTKYINKFLKLKQEASGLPEDVKSEEDIGKYISDYLEHEGILLEKERLVKNPGLRSLAKLALNSFFGKFGQRTNMKQSKFVTDIASMIQIFSDTSKLVTDFHIMSEEMMEIEYQTSSDFEQVSFNTNVIYSAFCSSYGRVKLWHLIDCLGKRVLYYDTDSVIFSSTGEDGEFMPKLGNYLGDLTDEISCKALGCKEQLYPGHFIEEFVSCGPKNYSYRLNSGEIVCKVRGFSLNHKNSLILNFESMKKALFAWKNKEKCEILTVKTEILRNKVESYVYTKEVPKQYGVVIDKRQVLDDLTTVPFGFKNLK